MWLFIPGMILPVFHYRTFNYFSSSGSDSNHSCDSGEWYWFSILGCEDPSQFFWYSHVMFLQRPVLISLVTTWSFLFNNSSPILDSCIVSYIFNILHESPSTSKKKLIEICIHWLTFGRHRSLKKKNLNIRS